MEPPSNELAELRGRIERLEARVEALLARSAIAPPVLPEPPVIALGGGEPAPPAAPGPVAGALPPVRRREINPTTWIAGAGAVIFLLGAIYGLAVSIQRGWISPPVRVLLGMVVGVALAAGAMRLLRTSRGLGVALLATGAGCWTFALYYGAQGARLFPASWGLVGAAVAVLGCGAIAARYRADGAMAVALATGLVTPLAFAVGRHDLTVVLGFLLVLAATQVLAGYLARVGEDWRFSRVLGTLGMWLVGLLVTLEFGRSATVFDLGLLLALAGAGLLLAWLPAQAGRPWAPGAATGVVLLGFALAAWSIWKRVGFEREGFAVVLVGLAAACALLTAPARRRVGDTGHDVILLVLATLFALWAVPVAWDWTWVVVVWGLGAALLSWAAHRQGENEAPGAGGLLVAAGLATAAASGVWLVLAWGQGAGEIIFVNRVFAGGVLAAVAWGLMRGAPGLVPGVAFIGLQVVAVNAVAWEFGRAVPAVRGEEATLALGAVLATLTYAVAGAGQWIRGLTGGDESPARALRAAGYVWLVVAVLKLFGHDLAGRDLVYRAVAALAVGAVFIGAALWANHRRRSNG